MQISVSLEVSVRFGAFVSWFVADRGYGVGSLSFGTVKENWREWAKRIFTTPARFFALVFTLFPLLVFSAISLERNAKLNWTGPVWLAIYDHFVAEVRANHPIEMAEPGQFP
jgi:hypothetical protein